MHPILLGLIDVVDILLQDGSDDEWEGGEHYVVEGNVGIVEEAEAGVRAVEGEVELGDGEDHVLVEEVKDHLADSDVVPAAVDEEEAPEALEFGEGVVAGLDGAHALLAVETHADVSHLYHGDIVCTISDCQGDLV